MSNRLQQLLNSSRPSNDEAPLRIVDMDDEEAVGIFETLGSEMTYLVYKQLHEEPKLPRELTENLDSSSQNIHYHLNKLEEAKLIEPVETWHSDNGVEMKVYAPVHDPLVISFSSTENRKQIHSTLSRTFGMISAVAFLSLIAEFLINWWITPEENGRDNTAGSGSGSGSGSGTNGEPDLLFEDFLIDPILSAPGLTLFLIGVTLVSAYSAYQLTR